jgi:hypothetical protein
MDLAISSAFGLFFCLEGGDNMLFGNVARISNLTISVRCFVTLSGPRLYDIEW